MTTKSAQRSRRSLGRERNKVKAVAPPRNDAPAEARDSLDGREVASAPAADAAPVEEEEEDRALDEEEYAPREAASEPGSPAQSPDSPPSLPPDDETALEDECAVEFSLRCCGVTVRSKR